MASISPSYAFLPNRAPPEREAMTLERSLEIKGSLEKQACLTRIALKVANVCCLPFSCCICCCYSARDCEDNSVPVGRCSFVEAVCDPYFFLRCDESPDHFLLPEDRERLNRATQNIQDIGNLSLSNEERNQRVGQGMGRDPQQPTNRSSSSPSSDPDEFLTNYTMAISNMGLH